MRRLTRALRDESGMTMIELMIAAMICVVGLLSTVAVLDQSRRVGDDAEARETIAHQAEREIEQIMSLDWANVGHPPGGLPVTAGTAPNPASYVNGTEYHFDRKDPARKELLVSVPAGSVPGPPTTWVDNQSRLEGTVHRFVTDVGGGQTRRVTVVVTADPPATVPPVYLSTLVTDPRP